ncbi:hypothetical protein OH77DRAFT_134049 [Trametes cingulata]|nr:hypothetical protein OH77DRAFT_134049 [Trametes cingulata]
MFRLRRRRGLWHLSAGFLRLSLSASDRAQTVHSPHGRPVSHACFLELHHASRQARCAACSYIVLVCPVDDADGRHPALSGATAIDRNANPHARRHRVPTTREYRRRPGPLLPRDGFAMGVPARRSSSSSDNATDEKGSSGWGKCGHSGTLHTESWPARPRASRVRASKPVVHRRIDIRAAHPRLSDRRGGKPEEPQARSGDRRFGSTRARRAHLERLKLNSCADSWPAGLAALRTFGELRDLQEESRKPRGVGRACYATCPNACGG